MLTGLAEAVAGAMMVIIGWVLALAPFGVFALAVGVAASSGTAAIAALAHYIAVVSSIGARGSGQVGWQPRGSKAGSGS